MKHYFPRFSVIIPILSLQFLARFQLLYWLTQLLFFCFAISALDELDDTISDESTFIAHVVENRMAEVLEMDSDLMRSACDWVALQEGAVCLWIVPYLLEVSLTIFYVAFCQLELLLFQPLLLEMRCQLLLFDFFDRELHLFSVFYFLRLFFLFLFLFLFNTFNHLLLLFLHFLYLLLLFNLSNDLIHSILMRNALNKGRKGLFLPFNFSSNPSKVHLLHALIATLLMKKRNFLLRPGKHQQSTCCLVQPMQNMQIFISHLVLKQSFDCVEVMSSSSMNYQTRWLANDHIILSFLYDFNRQVKTRRLRADRCMKNLIPIPQHIITCYLGIVNSDHSTKNALLVILR